MLLFRYNRHEIQVWIFNTKITPLFSWKCGMYNAKKFINTPNTFPVMKENMPSFVVLEHIKLSNLIKQRATNKEQLSQSRMSDQH